MCRFAEDMSQQTHCMLNSTITATNENINFEKTVLSTSGLVGWPDIKKIPQHMSPNPEAEQL